MGRPSVSGGRGWMVRTGLAVAIRPRLWGTAVRAGLRLATPGWWRHWPPRPTPPDAYLRFRAQTSNGSEAPPSPAEVVEYLEWCRRNEAVLH